MTEHPILFSAAMVRAILDCRKTQTRRVVKRQSVACVDNEKLSACAESPTGFAWQNGWVESCPYGKRGDTLWVRETWAKHPDGDGIIYRATDQGWDDNGTLKWRPSIFIPRSASRIMLLITDVRVQRVQEISEEDARAEGVESAIVAEGETDAGPCCQYSYVQSFAELWDFINKCRGYGWYNNPLVWAITFERVWTRGEIENE